MRLGTVHPRAVGKSVLGGDIEIFAARVVRNTADGRHVANFPNRRGGTTLVGLAVTNFPA